MTDWEDVKAGDLITVESSDRRQEVRGYVVSRDGELNLHAGHETAVRKYREWGWKLTARRTPIEPGTAATMDALAAIADAARRDIEATGIPAPNLRRAAGIYRDGADRIRKDGAQ